MSLLKGLVKLVIGKSTKKAGVGSSGANKIINIADQLIDDDQEIQEAIRKFTLSFEGKYSELQTNFERILRTIVRPLITLASVIILFYMGIKGLDIPWVVSWIGMIAVGGWFGARPFEKMKKLKKMSE